MSEVRFQRLFSQEDLRNKEPGLEFVDILSALEQDLISEKSDSPLSLACARLRRAGVSAEQVERYHAAVRAYLAHPSQGRRVEELREEEAQYGLVAFSGTRHYFHPRLYFTDKVQLMPSLQHLLPLRPRLTNRPMTEVKHQSVDGERVLSAFAEKKNPSPELAPEERLLMRLNRLLYALHEPFHVVQAGQIGDRLNILIAELELEDVFDAVEAKRLLETYSVSGHASAMVGLPSALEESVMGLPTQNRLDVFEGVSDRQRLYMSEWYTRTTYLDNQFEGVMDMIAADAIKPLLEKQPALLFWCHNTLATCVAGLQALKQRLEDGKEVSELGTKRLLATLSFIEPLYFAVFSTSGAFEEYLERTKDQPATLGRFMNGVMVEMEPMTRLEIENLRGDCLIRLHEQAALGGGVHMVSTWHYPETDRTHLTRTTRRRSYERDHEYPLTDVGVKRAAEMVVCAASKSWGFSQVEALFRRIQRTLDHEADDEMAMKELSEQVAEELGMTCTADQLRELFGVEWHLRTRILREDYTKRYVLRKEILEALEKHHPEQAHVYFQALFFHYELDTRQSMVLLGFSNGEQELVPRPPPDDEEFMLRHVFSWQEICSSRSLGIVGVDMMRLLPEEEMALKAMVDEARRERDNLSVETCKTWMRQMAAWKRRQQQVEER